MSAAARAARVACPERAPRDAATTLVRLALLAALVSTAAIVIHGAAASDAASRGVAAFAGVLDGLGPGVPVDRPAGLETFVVELAPGGRDGSVGLHATRNWRAAAPSVPN